MWELDHKESWGLKNWCSWTVVLEKILRVPWTVRRSNQSILKISPGCSLEGLMLKLKLQYFGHWCEELTHLKKPWCWERLRAGGEGVGRGWDGWMASLTQWVWASSWRWWRTGKPGVLQSMMLQSQTRLSDWTALNDMVVTFILMESKVGDKHYFSVCLFGHFWKRLTFELVDV